MPRYCLRCERELTVSDGPYGPKCAQILGLDQRDDYPGMYGGDDWAIAELPNQPGAMPYYDRNNNLLATDKIGTSKYDSQPPLPGDNGYGLRYGTESSVQSIIIENALRGIESDPKALAAEHPRYHLRDGTPVPPDIVEAYSYYSYMEQIAVMEARIGNLSERQRGQIDRMSPASRQFWLESLDVYDGKSRIEHYTHPYDLGTEQTPGVSDNFGDKRPDTGEPVRSHAGLDIYAVSSRKTTEGVPIYVVTDGWVIDVAPFVGNTEQITVRNADGSIVRYTEIASTVKKGSYVMQGQEIGKTKAMPKGDTMLHIEFYTGEKGYDIRSSKGALTQEGNRANPYVDDSKRYARLPYQRRTDMVDPTPIATARQHPDKPGSLESGDELNWKARKW